MSLCTATLVNNAEGTETGRGRGKRGLEELSGDKSKHICPADRARINKFHVIFVRHFKQNILMVVCEHPRSMFKMDAIFYSSLGLIFCITNTKEKEVPWDVM